jgi:hypothetical protein
MHQQGCNNRTYVINARPISVGNLILISQNLEKGSKDSTIILYAFLILFACCKQHGAHIK